MLRAIVLAVLFIVAIPSDPAKSWTHGSTALPSGDVICNVTTGVATGVGAGTCIASPATCNGVADDSAAFDAFNTWAVGTWQASHAGSIELLIPSGKSCIVDGTVVCNVVHASCPFINIKSLILSGYGATITWSANVISLGGLHLFDGGTARRSTRLATVTVGASCANVLTPAQSSIFTVGQYAMISGFDTQGLWNGGGFGFPPNPYYFENVIVSAIDGTHNCDGSAGGSVSFSAPLANTYKSTWPLYDAGSGANNINDQGGPATLYVIDPSWNSTIDIRGVSMEQTGQQIHIKSRTVSLTDVTLTTNTSQACAIPTENEMWTNTRVTATNCDIEADKLVSSWTWNGGTIRTIRFQSGGSFGTFTANNLTISSHLLGTPKRFVGNNVTIAEAQFGATSFGRTDEVTCVSCTINLLDVAIGANESGPLSAGTWGAPGQSGGPYNSTMSGGIITIPNTHGAVTWAVPGSNILFGGGRENSLVAQIVDVTQDGTNTFVQTSLAGGFPAVPLASGNLKIGDLGAPKFTCTSCTGSDPQIASLTQAPAAAPIYSYQTYTLTGAIGTTAQPTFSQWGNLVQLNMNVTNAYTGAGALSFHLSEFDNWPVLLHDFSTANYNTVGSGPAVNAKSVGNRQITPSGVTCPSGTCTGDAGLATLDAAGMWFQGQATQGSQFSANVSGSCPGVGCPSVTMTIQTNQGVVNP